MNPCGVAAHASRQSENRFCQSLTASRRPGSGHRLQRVIRVLVGWAHLTRPEEGDEQCRDQGCATSAERRAEERDTPSLRPENGDCRKAAQQADEHKNKNHFCPITALTL